MIDKTDKAIGTMDDYRVAEEETARDVEDYKCKAWA